MGEKKIGKKGESEEKRRKWRKKNWCRGGLWVCKEPLESKRFFEQSMFFWDLSYWPNLLLVPSRFSRIASGDTKINTNYKIDTNFERATTKINRSKVVKFTGKMLIFTGKMRKILFYPINSLPIIRLKKSYWVSVLNLLVSRKIRLPVPDTSL